MTPSTEQSWSWCGVCSAEGSLWIWLVWCRRRSTRSGLMHCSGLMQQTFRKLRGQSRCHNSSRRIVNYGRCWPENIIVWNQMHTVTSPWTQQSPGCSMILVSLFFSCRNQQGDKHHPALQKLIPTRSQIRRNDRASEQGMHPMFLKSWRIAINRQPNLFVGLITWPVGARLL